MTGTEADLICLQLNDMYVESMYIISLAIHISLLIFLEIYTGIAVND